MGDKEGGRPLLDHSPKSRIDISFTAGTQEVNLLVNRSCCGPYILNVTFGSRIVGVHQHSDALEPH